MWHDFGAESSRPASLLCTLRTHQSPSEGQHSLPACLLGFDRAGLAPAGFHQEVSPSHLRFPLFQVLPSEIFTVPTIRFQVLNVFLVLAHDRRRILHFNVSRHPTAEWAGQQLRETFPFDQVLRYLLRDRDRIFGQDFREQVRDMDIEEVLSTPRSPWQRAYVERVIGSIRRECLDHLIVFNEASLRRALRSYFGYYHKSRTHLSLARTRPSRGRFRRREGGESWQYPRSVDFTTATNDEPHEPRRSPL